MFDRLRQSLALRLAALYSLVFALGAAALFGVLYWSLAKALEARERAALEQRVEEFATALEREGPSGLVAQIKNDSSPEMGALFVRLLAPNGNAVFDKWPDDWIETQIQRLPLGGGLTVTQETQTIRVPQNAAHDYTIASRHLANDWTLHVGRILDSRPVFLAPLRRVFGVVGVGALLLSVAVGTLLGWRATRPLRQLSDTARRIIETGDLAARVPAPAGKDELAVLVRQLNALLDKNAVHVRVLRETLDNLAHDLRTPLTRLRGTAELALQDGGDPAEAHGALADCVNESDRVLHLLEALLDISAAEAGALKLNRTRMDLRSLVERAADLYREVAEEKHITVTVDQPVAVDVVVDAVRMGQAINNLLDNALKYTPAGGRVTIAARTDPEATVLTVSDNGPGVAPEEREAVFRRLYRSDTSRSQRGLGLGLSLVKAIVEAHAGRVGIEDESGGGARFVVRLPRR